MKMFLLGVNHAFVKIGLLFERKYTNLMTMLKNFITTLNMWFIAPTGRVFHRDDFGFDPTDMDTFFEQPPQGVGVAGDFHWHEPAQMFHDRLEDLPEYYDVFEPAPAYDASDCPPVWSLFEDTLIDDAYIGLFEMFDLPNVVVRFQAILRRQLAIAHLPARHTATAYPVLGDERTCDCWMVQETQLVSGPFSVAGRVWLRKELRGLGAPASLLGFPDALLVSKQSNEWLFMSKIDQLCGCCFVSIHSAHSCHVTDDVSFESGHSVKTIATMIMAHDHIKWQIGLTYGFLEHSSVLNNVVDGGEPHCPCAETQIETTAGPSWKPKRLMVSRTSDLEDATVSKATEFYANHITSLIRQYESLAGNRPKPGWDDLVNDVWGLWWSKYPSTADVTMKVSRHEQLPQCVKARIKAIEKRLSKSMGAIGVKIARDRAFETETYQEWVEMETRRYETANEMSRSEQVRSLPQSAQEWLKSSAAKHQLNTLVRAMINDPSYGYVLKERFDKSFIYHGGKALPLPKPILERVRITRQRNVEQAERNAQAARLAIQTDADLRAALAREARARRDARHMPI